MLSYHLQGQWAFSVTWKIWIVSCIQIFEKTVNTCYKVRPFSILWKANYLQVLSAVVILQIVNFFKEIKYFLVMLFFILLKAWNTIFWTPNSFLYSTCSSTIYFIYQILLCPLNLPFLWYHYDWTYVETSLHKELKKKWGLCIKLCRPVLWIPTINKEFGDHLVIFNSVFFFFFPKCVTNPQL